MSNRAQEQWEDEILEVLMAIGAALLAVGLVCFFVKSSYAHMHDRPELTQWMQTLSSTRTHCCSDTEAKAVDWRRRSEGECRITQPNGPQADKNAKGQYCVLVDNQWWVVPEESVITEPNRDGRSLLWSYPTVGSDGKATDLYIRCFLPEAGA